MLLIVDIFSLFRFGAVRGSINSAKDINGLQSAWVKKYRAIETEGKKA
jgi:hypothetical protein